MAAADIRFAQCSFTAFSSASSRARRGMGLSRMSVTPYFAPLCAYSNSSCPVTSSISQLWRLSRRRAMQSRPLGPGSSTSIIMMSGRSFSASSSASSPVLARPASSVFMVSQSTHLWT